MDELRAGTALDVASGMQLIRGAAAVCGVWWIALTTTAAVQPVVNPTAAMMKEFRDRAEAYLALHKKVADDLPPLKETDDPQKIATREKLLGESIAKARAGAHEGDTFGDIASLVTKAVRNDLGHRTPADRRALFAEMPARVPPLKVNDIYPPSVPLLTFPPALLQSLPPLPDGLEYRFYARHLILRDAKANIVVDILRNVAPA
jgi:hypothetical protein